jgi:RimJ/RimL family protein N-acetyltransferase
MAEVMHVQPVTLTGRAVRLEPLSLEHSPGLAAIGLEDSIWRYMPYGLMHSEADIRGWVKAMLKLAAEGTDLPFAVIDLRSNCVAGSTRYLEIRPDHRGLEIGGTWYGAAYRRTRVNTESKFLLLQHAFETLHCIRVQLKTDSRNERSQRAIERLGAVREGMLRNHLILPDGHIRDSIYYSVLDSEWPAVKDRLQEMLAR